MYSENLAVIGRKFSQITQLWRC